MDMYDVKKMHGINVSSNNVFMECPLSLTKENEQVSFWKSVEFLQGM